MHPENENLDEFDNPLKDKSTFATFDFSVSNPTPFNEKKLGFDRIKYFYETKGHFRKNDDHIKL